MSHSRFILARELINHFPAGEELIKQRATFIKTQS